ncbi:MAG: NTP transferase domain-containing protein [Clostridia bacterium]|nr:NTP transferase domain-containing protein [Clostridia bacterium]
MENMAIILASGAGTRMMSDIPKPLHRVCGMTMAEHTLRALGTLAPVKLMTVAHQREAIERELNGQVEFVFQDKNLGWGTGHAVMCCLDHLRGKSGRVIVTSCDKPLVFGETYARLIDEVSRGASCAMLTGISENPFSHNRIIREGGSVIMSKRPSKLCANEIMIKETDASVYCFDIETLVSALSRLELDNGEYHLSDVVGIIRESGGYIVAIPALEKCECMGVNDRIQLSQAEREMRRIINNRHMRHGVTIIDPESTYIEKGVKIGRDSVLYPGCVIGRGTVIGAGCTIIASHIDASHIGAGCTVIHSVLFGADIPQASKIGPFFSKARDCGAKACT